MAHLYLAGFRGTGKSSLAALLAPRLGFPAVDLDLEIQTLAGRTIAEIFASVGEAGFRDLESEALFSVASRESLIVALGGGAVLREENRRAIRESGRCVRLVASAKTIAARIAGDQATATQRPPLTQLGQLDEIRNLLEERRAAYLAAADFAVDTEGKGIAAVADEVERWWRGQA